MHARVRVTRMRERGRRAYAASALSRRPILITGGAPRDFSRKKLSGLALLTPFLKPISRVNRVKRMRVLPARECVQKTVRTPSFARCAGCYTLYPHPARLYVELLRREIGINEN